MTYGVGNPGPCLRQAQIQICGGFNRFKGITKKNAPSLQLDFQWKYRYQQITNKTCTVSMVSLPFKSPHIIPKMYDNIKMDSTIARSVNARRKLTTSYECGICWSKNITIKYPTNKI